MRRGGRYEAAGCGLLALAAIAAALVESPALVFLLGVAGLVVFVWGRFL